MVGEPVAHRGIRKVDEPLAAIAEQNPRLFERLADHRTPERDATARNAETLTRQRVVQGDTARLGRRVARVYLAARKHVHTAEVGGAGSLDHEHLETGWSVADE